MKVQIEAFQKQVSKKQVFDENGNPVLKQKFKRKNGTLTAVYQLPKQLKVPKTTLIDVFDTKTGNWIQKTDTIDVLKPHETFQRFQTIEGKKVENKPVMLPVFETVTLPEITSLKRFAITSASDKDVFNLFSDDESLNKLFDVVLKSLFDKKEQQTRINEKAKKFGSNSTPVKNKYISYSKELHFLITIENIKLFDTDANGHFAEYGKFTFKNSDLARLKATLITITQDVVLPLLKLKNEKLTIEEPTPKTEYLTYSELFEKA